MKKKNKKIEEKSQNKVVMTIFWITIAVIVVVFASQFLFTSEPRTNDRDIDVDPSELSGLDEFANCLNENEVVFYGTRTCPACAQQRNIFGDSIQYLNYVECDASAQNQNICSSENIRVVPTWKFSGVPKEGILTLEELSRESGCEL